MSKSGFGKFLLGTAVGVGIGVLVAPKKGSETREDLKKKIDEFLTKVKSLDKEEVKKEIEAKIEKLKKEIKELDKEKVLSIAKEKSNEIKDKCQDLVDLAIDKGTPVLKNAAVEVRDKTVDVMKDMIGKLEEIDINTKKNDKNKEKKAKN